MALGDALESIINTAAKGVGNLQVGVNKILWGSANTQPIASAKYDTVSGSLTYTTTPTIAKPPGKKRLVDTGVFNALDALNTVDLCDVVTYAITNVNIKKKPRSENPTESQKALYTLQDKAFQVQVAIDKYLAYPNVFISDYFGTGPDPITQEAAISGSGLPAGQTNLAGSSITKYNVFNLTRAIIDTFDIGIQSPTGSLFTAEEKNLAGEVLGLASNLNFVNNSLTTFKRITDYRNISNTDLVKLNKTVTDLRAVCVVIQTLDFKSALALASNFLNIDIRSQIQKLSNFIDVTRILPTIKNINDQIQSFIRIALKVQNILSQAQFVIKIILLLIKVFRFLKTFFFANPLPSLFTTVGVQAAFSEAKKVADDSSLSLIQRLRQVNALLSVVTIFIRYLLANAYELQIRLRTLILTLEACDATKDSDVIQQLKKTSADLDNLQNTLSSYIINYDSKTSPNTATFGLYDIRVIDEELTDLSIVNKRRRGVALDKNGNIVLQSDLTFATNTSVIIEEVKQRLVAAGLVQPTLSNITSTSLAVIAESLNYLDNNDVLQDDLNIQVTENLDTPDNQNEDLGTGLNAFINNLPGGKRLRKRVRSKVQESRERLAGQINSEKVNAENVFKATNLPTTSI